MPEKPAGGHEVIHLLRLGGGLVCCPVKMAPVVALMIRNRQATVNRSYVTCKKCLGLGGKDA